MFEKVVGHVQLYGFDVVGDAGETTGAGVVGEEVAGVAVEVGPGEETGLAGRGGQAGGGVAHVHHAAAISMR